MKKGRLESEEKVTEEEPTTIDTELEQPSYTLQPSALLPVEEEESGMEEESDDEGEPIEIT